MVALAAIADELKVALLMLPVALITAAGRGHHDCIDSLDQSQKSIIKGNGWRQRAHIVYFVA